MNTDLIAGIRAYIHTEILDDTSVDITPDEDLILSGILDSLSIMRLVDYLENKHAIEIPPDHVTPGNLGSLEQISTYVISRVKSDVEVKGSSPS